MGEGEEGKRNTERKRKKMAWTSGVERLGMDWPGYCLGLQFTVDSAAPGLVVLCALLGRQAEQAMKNNTSGQQHCPMASVTASRFLPQDPTLTSLHDRLPVVS